MFAKGINPSDPTTYNNVQQGRLPTCWAASGSNVIGHWQENHITPPSGTPISAQEVYNTYLSIYNSYAGSMPDVFYQWWLGHHHASSLGGFNPTENFETAGGYYKDIYTSQETVQNIAWSYSDVFGYSFSGLEANVNLSRAIYYALKEGFSMSLHVPSDSHAITLYGATFDTGTNLLTSIYVCDSSGASFDKQSISQVRLGLRKDTTDGTDRLCLLGYYHEGNELTDVNNGEYLANVYFLGNSKEDTRNFVFSIPEPSAFGALAGIGALALVAVRRRRK